MHTFRRDHVGQPDLHWLALKRRVISRCSTIWQVANTLSWNALGGPEVPDAVAELGTAALASIVKSE